MIFLKTHFIILSFLFFLVTACSNNNSGKPDANVPQDQTSVANTETKKVAGNINTLKSSINWLGSDLLKKHTGTIGIAGGSINFDPSGKIVSGMLEVDMKAITVTDKMAEEKKPKLIKHLQNNDFFAADSFPISTFEIVNAFFKNEGRYLVEGNLTIRGKSIKITVPVNVTNVDGLVNIKTVFTFDRTKWGVNYHSKSVDAQIKDRAIDDMIELTIDLYCTK